MEISSPGQKSRVALQQGIVPVSCPTRVSGKNQKSAAGCLVGIIRQEQQTVSLMKIPVFDTSKTTEPSGRYCASGDLAYPRSISANERKL